jgi:hypothetical protein
VGGHLYGKLHVTVGLRDDYFIESSVTLFCDDLTRLETGVHCDYVQDKTHFDLRSLSGDVAGGINLLGHMFNVSGPVALDVYLFHDQDKTPEQILAALDSEVKKLQDTPVDAATLARARVKMRSALYDAVDGFFGFGRADLLASYALFDNDPAKINRIEAEFEKVTPALVQKAAREYLRTTNRTVLVIEPKKDEKAADAAAPAQGVNR